MTLIRHSLTAAVLTLGLGGLSLTFAMNAPAFAQQAPAAETAAPAQPDPATVLAKVGEETITEADIVFATEDLAQELQSVPPADRKSFLLGILIDMKLMAQAARTAGMDKDEAYKRRLTYLEDRSLRRAYFDTNIGGAATPEAVKAAYDAYAAEYVPEDEVRARHILVASEDEAKAIIADIKGGASFEDIAREKSIDTGSGAQGGDLGFFGKGQMVPPFETAAFALEAGQVSEPVQSQFGWHIIKVEDKRKSAPVPMDQVIPQLQQKVVYDAYNAAILGLKDKTKVEIVDADLAAQVAADEAARAAEDK